MDDDGNASSSEEDPFSSYGLQTIDLDHKEVFDSYFAACESRLSDYSFANTFIWRDSIHLRWRILHNCLCVFANGDGLSMLFPPLGKGNTQTALRESLDICSRYNRSTGFTDVPRVEYVSREILHRMPPNFSAMEMSGDYVYATQRMIDLDGGDLASKRQARNRFARRYTARTEPFDHSHVEPCLRLLHAWAQQHEEADCASVSPAVRVKRAKEAAATTEAIIHADELGLKGMVLYANEQIVGFTFGHMLDNSTCSIVIEKADRNFAGAAQYIFSEFCRQYWANTQWCNVGDDWEVPSLAWTKQSYRPAHRLPKWILQPLRQANAKLAGSSCVAAVV